MLMMRRDVCRSSGDDWCGWLTRKGWHSVWVMLFLCLLHSAWARDEVYKDGIHEEVLGRRYDYWYPGISHFQGVMVSTKDWMHNIRVFEWYRFTNILLHRIYQTPFYKETVRQFWRMTNLAPSWSSWAIMWSQSEIHNSRTFVQFLILQHPNSSISKVMAHIRLCRISSTEFHGNLLYSL